MSDVILRGNTWAHTRGVAPLLAASAAWSMRHPDVRIEWDARSLTAFGEQPLPELVADYDLLVIDYPHVPHAARTGYLTPLDNSGRTTELAALADQSVGPSHASYEFDGRQWALAIDAAAQVAVYRPDLLSDPPDDWPAVLDLARQGRVLWSPSAGSFYTLAANAGTPIAAGEDELIPEPAGLEILDMLHRLAELVPEWCQSADPIGICEVLASSEDVCYALLIFGYVNYSVPAFRRHRLRFVDLPAGRAGVAGSCLGGAGIAISAESRHAEAAEAFAYWVASAQCQVGRYFDSGGQPGNAVAWDDPRLNAASWDVFTGTRATLDQAWTRPRLPQWMTLHRAIAANLRAALAGDISDTEALRRMTAEYHSVLNRSGSVTVGKPQP